MAVKLQVEQESERRMRFSVEGIPTSFANLIRRYSMSHIPVFAIDSITVYENSSSLFDEYIAHRIGLVPLKMASGFKPEDEVLFSLDCHGPCTVAAEDLKSMDSKVKVAKGCENIPLVKLMEGQSLRLEAKAKMGMGRKHAKFQTGIAGYEIAGSEYKFKVETFMQMEPRQMMLAAADLVLEKCDEFSSALSEIKKQ